MGSNFPTLRVHAQQILDDLPRRFPELDAEARAYLGTVALGVKERAVPIETRHETIRVDPRLTEQGRKEKYGEVAKMARPLVDFLEEHLKTLNGSLSVIKGRLFPKPAALSGSEAILELMTFQEIRRAFVGRPQSELDASYLRALEHGQKVIANALVSSPVGSMVSPEIEVRGREDFARKKDPENFSRLEEKERLISEIDALATHARMAMQNLEGYANN